MLFFVSGRCGLHRKSRLTAVIGSKWNGGDGNSGVGLGFIGKANYENPNGFESNVLSRKLVSIFSNHRIAGLKGELNFDTNRDGTGIQTKLSPAWGTVDITSPDQLFEHNASRNNNDVSYKKNGARLEPEIVYGFEILDRSAIRTPFFNNGIFESGRNNYGIESRVYIGSDMNINFERNREALANGNMDGSVRLEGFLEWKDRNLVWIAKIVGKSWNPPMSKKIVH